MKLTLKAPVTPFVLIQRFGGSGEWYRANGVNVDGHNGIDLQTYHGQPVYASHDGLAYYTDDDGKEGDGVVIITDKEYDFEDKQAFFKTIYWHLCDPHKEPGFASPIYLNRTSRTKPVAVKTGDIIGYADNTGFSFGDHLHYGLKPVAVGESPGSWWNIRQDNGYGGAVDPLPYVEIPKALFQREMGIGASGSDVLRLQVALGMPLKYQTGYFGTITKGAVMFYQWQNNISPVSGYVGPKTLAKLNGG